MPKRLVTRVTDRRGPEAALRHDGLKAVLAVGLVALGVAAFLEPTSTAVPSARLAGTILLAAGLFQVALAITAHRHDPLARGLGIGIANTSVGALFVAAPALSVATLSLVLAVAQIVIGAERLLTALRDRGAHWPLTGALGALLLASGTAIALGWPAAGMTAIGRFVGINLVVEGATWLTILLRSRPPAVTLTPLEQPTDPVRPGRP